MSPIERTVRFARAQDGGTAVIVALSLTMLFGFVALGVDVAALYRDRARVQAVSDLAAVSAMAAPASAEARAAHALSRNTLTDGEVETVQTGRFLRNPEIAASARFTPLPAGSAGINAVRVGLRRDAPLHFSRIFTEASTVALSRPALATRTGGASFSLDSHVAHFNDATLNAALAGEFGAGATISAGGVDVLADAQVNLGSLLGLLGAATGRNPASVLEGTTTGADLIDALQTLLPPAAAGLLNGLESATGATAFEISALVGGMDTSLGLTVTEFLAEVDVTALDVVQALLTSENAGDAVELIGGVAVPGVISSTVRLSGGEPPADSGWIGLGETGVQLQRAAARIEAEIESDPGLLGALGVGVAATSLHLPLSVELAGATATLTDLACGGDAPGDILAQFATAPTPLHPANGTSVAALYLGTLPAGAGVIDPATLDYADLLTVDVTIPVPLLPDITLAALTIQGRSQVTVGRSDTDTIAFARAEIAAGDTVRGFGSEALLSTALSDLLGQTDLRVKPGQTGLVTGAAAPLVAAVIEALPAQLAAGLLAPVDAVLDQALDATGVTLGMGELALTGHHCEPIRLVR